MDLKRGIFGTFGGIILYLYYIFGDDCSWGCFLSTRDYADDDIEGYFSSKISIGDVVVYVV